MTYYPRGFRVVWRPSKIKRGRLWYDTGISKLQVGRCLGITQERDDCFCLPTHLIPSAPFPKRFWHPWKKFHPQIFIFPVVLFYSVGNRTGNSLSLIGKPQLIDYRQYCRKLWYFNVHTNGGISVYFSVI